jgi:hypothetical protein
MRKDVNLRRFYRQFRGRGERQKSFKKGVNRGEMKNYL